VKPSITTELIMYTPIQGNPYTVHVIDGASNAPYTQGHIYCTGCGTGHHYRWNQDGPWVRVKCPVCSTVSAWFEEYDED